MGRPDNRVEYDIWYSVTDQKMLDFLLDFQRHDKKFSDDVLMAPHNRFWDCPKCDK